MRRPRTTAVLASAFAVAAASAMVGSVPWAGAEEPVEGPGRNLSVPVVFAEGIGLTGATVTADIGIRGESYPAVNLVEPTTLPEDLTPYYAQNTDNEWQAEWTDGTEQVEPVAAQADWGDNLVRQTWTGESKVRVEVGLTLDLDAQPLAEPMVGYEMKSLSGTQSSELWGAVGVTDSDPAALVTKQFPNAVDDASPAIYTPTAKLTIEKVDTQGGTVLGDGPVFEGRVADGTEGAGFAAEVNGSGRILYGYNWDLTKLDLASIGLPTRPKSGWYRITFSLEPTVTIGETEITRHSTLASLNPVDLTQETSEGEEGGGGPPDGTGGGGSGTGDHSSGALLVAAVDEGSGSGGVTAPYYKPALGEDNLSTSLDLYIESSRHTTAETVPPTSLASAPEYAKSTIAVSVTATDNASLLYVDLYAKSPTATEFSFVKRFLPTGEQTSLTGTFDYPAAAGDGVYAFATRAGDTAGNLEALPLTTEAATTVDTVAPTSAATAPASAISQYVEVSYTAADNAAGSGFQQGELFLRRPGATVYDKVATLLEPSGTVIVKADAGNGSYEFYTRATDAAGNVEAAPATPDAVTVLTLGGYVPPPTGGGGIPVDTAGQPTPSASPSASPSGGPVSPGPGQTQAPTCATITIDAPKTITAGEPARVVLRGPAGTPVQLRAYSQPSTTYRTVRAGTLDAAGTATFDVWPYTNTRLFARQAQCTIGGTTVVMVRPRLSMNVERLRLRTYEFAGSAPSVQPLTVVSVYRYQADGRQILTAQARVTAEHTWRLTRTFLGTGTFRFVARTGAGIVNAAGTSPVRLVNVR